MRKITKQHFRAFEGEARCWLEWFGIKNWQLSIVHSAMEDDDCVAYCLTDLGQRRCMLALNTEIYQESEIRNEQIRRSGFHEVVELLLARVRKLGDARMTDQEKEVYDDAIHEVIRVLENTLFERRPYPKVGK